MAAKPASSPVIDEAILNRKGSPNTAGVPAEVRRLLNLGLIETKNLSEWLIIDHGELAAAVFPHLGLEKEVAAVQQELVSLREAAASGPKKSAVVHRALLKAFSSKRLADQALGQLKKHSSDIVRCWACALVGNHSSFSLEEKFQRLRPLADDANMGVRECAWLEVRDHLAKELDLALQLLQPWVHLPEANLRRFASEATRPRGVWCRHITELKESPQRALALLEPLHSDSSLYVRNSVANWLNDASKTQPEWVKSLCQRWQNSSTSKETAYIVKRALRTLRKKEML